MTCKRIRRLLYLYMGSKRWKTGKGGRVLSMQKKIIQFSSGSMCLSRVWVCIAQQGRVPHHSLGMNMMYNPAPVYRLLLSMRDIVPKESHPSIFLESDCSISGNGMSARRLHVSKYLEAIYRGCVILCPCCCVFHGIRSEVCAPSLVCLFIRE